MYQAEDTLLGMLVALKAVRKGDDEILHLRREARHLASLKHAGIPSYLDFFEERGHWYLVMECIKGGHVLTTRPLAIRQIIWIGKQVCNILYYLHHQCNPPVIHRDIKPSNIMVATSQRLYLLDFGISCHPGPNEGAVGSKGYAAPEQWQEGLITQKADVYSLGMMLRQLLTGQAPTEQISTTQKPLSQTLHIQQQQADLPEYSNLVDLLSDMTAEFSDDRPNVEEIWQELERVHQALLKAGTYAKQ